MLDLRTFFAIPMTMVNQNPCVTVYGLSTSADGRIRYVGQTIHPLHVRLRQHLNWARKGKKSALFVWIRKHEANGESVNIFALEEHAVLHEAEIRLIAFYKRMGAALVNSTKGGEGIVGLVRTKEHTQKIADAQRGKKRAPLSVEMKQRLSAILKTRIFSEEHRRKISEKRKAQGISPEAQVKMAEGRRKSPLWRGPIPASRNPELTKGVTHGC